MPVDYAPVKFVKKPAGSPPGFVNYTNYKTILADPSEELVKRLAGSRQTRCNFRLQRILAMTRQRQPEVAGRLRAFTLY